MNPIAVTLLTGFLGAGKTTLLRHILNEQHGYKIAVIENEFGEVSVDDQLIGDRATQIKTLTNGCICCSRSNELEDALLDLLDNLDKGNIQFDRLVIECTGMADPGPIIQTFFSHEILCQRYLLDGVIALVDAVHADEQMNQFTIAQSQVGYADRILLTKTDVAGEAEKLRERLARINARAPVYTVTHGDIDLGLLFNTNGFMLEENVVSTKPRFHFIADKQNDISSIVVELDYPVDISEVSRVMEINCCVTKGCCGLTANLTACCSRASSASTAPTGTARGAMKNRIAQWCLSGFSCRRKRFGQRLRG